MSDTKTRIRRLREFSGFSQEIVADQLGITQAAYSRLESGRTRLDLDRLEQIAKLYGLTHLDLMTKSSTKLLKILIDNPDFTSKWEGVNGDIRGHI